MAKLQDTRKATESATGSYSWDKVANKWVKVCHKPRLMGRQSTWEREDEPFAKKIMRGFRRAEERGNKTATKVKTAKALWGAN